MDKLFLISGPSGSGKTTLMKHVLENEVITITTRPMREGEVNGVDYHFVSKDEFEGYIQNNQLIEYNQYVNGHYYGITKEKLEEKLQNGDAYNVVDFNGMKSFKEYYKDSVSIFIYTSFSDVRKQLFERGGEEQDILTRLDAYKEEIANASEYDYVIKNKHGKFDEVVEIVKAIINAEK